MAEARREVPEERGGKGIDPLTAQSAPVIKKVRVAELRSAVRDVE